MDGRPVNATSFDWRSIYPSFAWSSAINEMNAISGVAKCDICFRQEATILPPGFTFHIKKYSLNVNDFQNMLYCVLHKWNDIAEWRMTTKSLGNSISFRNDGLHHNRLFQHSVRFHSNVPVNYGGSGVIQWLNQEDLEGLHPKDLFNVFTFKRVELNHFKPQNENMWKRETLSGVVQGWWARDCANLARCKISGG